ncbi:MAG: hypothetical protein A2075_12175 [Geobacteraceae bacterium GWC2_58_44]|nr:MAG: hypothetical protein A2075_12175 [Geobacteraceae bacterium GWC2_58_44]HBG06319.1 phage virion morphogenesis protein [Geobacter sp.]
MFKVLPQGLDEQIARINVAISRGENMTPLMRRISGILGSGFERNFAAEGRPAWPDLAPSTKKARARKGKWPGQILQVSAAGLASSVQEFFTATTAGAGTNKFYSAIQHFGGTIVQHPRSQKVYFRADEKTGVIGNRFVRKSKSNFSQWATSGTRTITIPARPFAAITAQEVLEIEVATLDFLTMR